MTQKVILSVYDLTRGMAKTMSMAFIGQQIDAIYHTSLVVYGKQYFYGGGICEDVIDQTPYGKPIQKIELGETEVPQQLFKEFLQELGPKFSPEKYDIIEKNCNHFTDEASDFLVGKGIPKHILNQPKDLLATPAGQMIKPLLMQLRGQPPIPGTYPQ